MSDILRRGLEDAVSQEMKHAYSPAKLTDEQASRLCKGIPAKDVSVYREFNPRRDAIQYTVYFLDTNSDKRRRVDFDIESAEIAQFGTGKVLEDNVSTIARIFIRAEIYRAQNKQWLTIQRLDGR